MSKIFITGGTGCIGAVTVFKLLTGFGDQIEQTSSRKTAVVAHLFDRFQASIAFLEFDQLPVFTA